jgi:hypothetical protein
MNQTKNPGNVFFFPIQLDLVVFSNVAQLVVVDKEVAHPLQEWLSEHGKNLIQHFERIKEKSVSLCSDWIVKDFFFIEKKIAVYFLGIIRIGMKCARRWT